MYLEIITPDTKIFSGEIRLIQVPGTKGSFAILRNHAPIISTLEPGKIRIITQNGEENFFTIDGGIIEVKDNKVIVLA